MQITRPDRRRARAVAVLCAVFAVGACSILIPPLLTKTPIVPAFVPDVDGYTTDHRSRPSVTAYAGKQVQLSGRFARSNDGNPVRLDCMRGSDLPYPWFSDAGIEMSVILPPHARVRDGEPVTIIGILTATPTTTPVIYPPEPWHATIQVDSMKYQGEPEGAFPAMTARDYCSAICFTVIAAIVFGIPYWLRCFVVALAPPLVAGSKHCCPVCGYDLRGTPLQCPECNTRVAPPNYPLRRDTSRI